MIFDFNIVILASGVDDGFERANLFEGACLFVGVGEPGQLELVASSVLSVNNFPKKFDVALGWDLAVLLDFTADIGHAFGFVSDKCVDVQVDESIFLAKFFLDGFAELLGLIGAARSDLHDCWLNAA